MENKKRINLSKILSNTWGENKPSDQRFIQNKNHIIMEELIMAMALTLPQNHTVIKQEEMMYLDGGSNVSRFTRHWWGVRRYMSRVVTRDQVRVMRSAARNVNTAGWVLGKLTKGVSVVFGNVFSWNAGHVADRLQARLDATSNRGTIIDMHFTGTWATRTQ